jgi:hypothetical protein
MQKNKSKDQFWLVLGTLNVLAMLYPMSSYLQADADEEKILAVCVLIGLALLLAIIDTVSIVVAYSQ